MHEQGVAFIAPRLMTRCLIEEIRSLECHSEGGTKALPANSDIS
jgi:hypothetical protein